ncbi:MAG: response regulator [Anaerolineae bacterium]|nr:response regulator [Anaerolineae bacterium]
MTYTVLVVDDDRGLRTLYRSILENQGYTVHEAANGAEALQYLLSYTPHVILMDMLMPMLGGEIVLQRMQHLTELAHTRVVVLTAYPRFSEIADLPQVSDFLVKPVKPSDIIAAVETAIHDSVLVKY